MKYFFLEKLNKILAYFHIQYILNEALKYSLKIILFIVFFWIGIRLIVFFIKKTKKVLYSKELDPTVISFLENLITASLKFFLVILLLTNVFGVNGGSIITIIGAMGLALSLAIHPHISNFFAGVLVVFFRPYKVGDYLEIQTKSGTVISISLFYTVIKNDIGMITIVPNNSISTTAIVNHTKEEKRICEFFIDIDTAENVQAVKEIIRDLLSQNTNISLDVFYPSVSIHSFNNTSFKLAIKIWIDTKEYNSLYVSLIEDIRESLITHKIKIV